MPHLTRDTWIDLVGIALAFAIGFAVMFWWGTQVAIDALGWAMAQLMGWVFGT